MEKLRFGEIKPGTQGYEARWQSKIQTLFFLNSEVFFYRTLPIINKEIVWNQSQIMIQRVTPCLFVSFIQSFNMYWVPGQMVKNPRAMQETWVWSLGWDYPLEEDTATQSSTLAWRIPMDRGAWVRHDWATKHSTAPALYQT